MAVIRKAAALIALLVIVGCDEQRIVQVADHDVTAGFSQWAYATEAARQGSPSPSPGPSPTPTDDKCENCNGTGKLGDTRVALDCPVCDGTGKRTTDEPTEPVAKQSHAVIQMASLPGCEPCERWWRDERPKYERQGWRVTRIGIADTGFTVAPSFVLMNGETEIGRHQGWMSTASASRLVSGSGGEVQAATTKATIANGRHTYRDQWSFPGGIGDHLMGQNHRLSADEIRGKSQRELEVLHSQLHQGMRSGRSRRVITSRAYTSCPTCP